VRVRVLAIGDIHTETELLDKALAVGREHRVDKVLSVGDIVDGPNDPLPCIAALQAARADVVRGNHERWVTEGHPLEPFDYPDDALAWIAALPSTREYDTPTGRLLLCHGIGENDMVRFGPDTVGYALDVLDDLWRLARSGRYRWMIAGHTHEPMVRVIGELTVINAGTLVLLQEPCCVIADFQVGTVEHYSLLPTVKRVAQWPCLASGQ
jgi:predicted phosphodiesterase